MAVAHVRQCIVQTPSFVACAMLVAFKRCVHCVHCMWLVLSRCAFSRSVSCVIATGCFSVSLCNSVFFHWVGDLFVVCCADGPAILEIALFATCAFFFVDVSGFFEAALLLICVNVHTLLFEVCDGGIRGAGTSSTARRPQSVASLGGFCVLNAGSMDSARIVLGLLRTGESGRPSESAGAFDLGQAGA